MASSPLFSRFCDLVKEIGQIQPKKIAETGLLLEPEKQVKKVLRTWIYKLRSEYKDGELPPEVSTHFFRFLFPEEGTRRRYHMQESTLAKNLSAIYKKIKNFPTNFAEAWKESDLDLTVSTSIGSLGKALELELKSSTQPSRKTFKEIDELLDELASKSDASSASLQQNKSQNNPLNILKELYRDLSSYEAGIITQIILRDLSPFLQPIPSHNRYEALTEYNTTVHYTLTLKDAFYIYDRRLAEMYNFTKDLGYILEQADSGSYTPQVKLGIPVGIAKSCRPACLSKITDKFSDLVHCDIKYDGHRVQFHYDSTKPNYQKATTNAEDRQVTIFSKSCRDSTVERFDLVKIIQRALKGMGIKNGIFEAEMIAFDLDEGEDGTFDQLNSMLKPRNATKQKGKETHGQRYDTGDSTLDDSISSIKEVERGMGLKLVFFDILYLNDEFLGGNPFSERRAILEKSIKTEPTTAMLSKQIIVNFANRDGALDELRKFFAEVITDRGEGLMLRSATASHLEGVMKVKKDFIPGCGDTLDFIVLGGSWTKERGRELYVPTGIFTTFFVGVEMPSSPRSRMPHYRLQFTTAYGLDRKQLLNLNNEVLDTAIPLTFSSQVRRYQLPGFKYTFEIASNLNSRAGAPTYMFKEPISVELTGAGFQRDLYPIRSYSLRWPRIIKIGKPDAEPLTFEKLNQTAEEAMLRIKEPFDCFTFTEQITPILSKEEMISKEEKSWIKKLEISDGINRMQQSTSPSRVSTRVSSPEKIIIPDHYDLVPSSPVATSDPVFSALVSSSANSPQIPSSPITPATSIPNTPLCTSPTTSPSRIPSIEITESSTIMEIVPSSPILRSMEKTQHIDTSLLSITNKSRTRQVRRTASETTPSTPEKAQPRVVKRSASMTSLKNSRRSGEPSFLSAQRSIIPPIVSRFLKESTKFNWTIFPPLSLSESIRFNRKYPSYQNSIHSVYALAGFKNKYNSDDANESIASKPGRIYVKHEFEVEEARRVLGESFYDPNNDEVRPGIKQRVKILKLEALELENEKEKDLLKYIWK